MCTTPDNELLNAPLRQTEPLSVSEQALRSIEMVNGPTRSSEISSGEQTGRATAILLQRGCITSG